MGKLELKLLGGLEIRLDGTFISEFKSRKSQALLCYLAVTGTQHSRDWLAGMFWGDMPEAKARMNLSQAVTTLRRLFQPYIITTRHFISINPDSNIWTDISALDTADGEDVKSLHQAAQLFRGDFLEGFYIPKSPEFEFWMLGERSRCRENILQVLDKLVIHYALLVQPDWDSAIDFTKQRLGIEPWHEETHRILMQLYAVSGQRSTALKQYEKCQSVLMAELGVEPGVDTTHLYDHIRSSSSTALIEDADVLVGNLMPDRATTPNGRPGSKESISSNIPFWPTDFIGREQELEELDDLFFNQNSRLVTITGPGGIGKTRLAVKFAERIITQESDQKSQVSHTEIKFPDGVFFVSFEAIKSGESIVPAVAEGIGFRLDRGKKQLLNYIKTKRLLLILDNFEHLLDSALSILDIISSAPHVQILVTSRENLRLYGEQVFPLQGLSFPTDHRTRISDFPAGQLFLKSALRQDPNFILEESDQEDIARICQLVEGMPLALELSATWTNSLPLASIAEQIQKDYEFLSTEMSNLPARHRSLHAVIEGSLERLAPAEQTLFSQLVIFEDGFTLQAAKAVTGAIHKHLAVLIDKSLLRYSKSQDRYSIHSLLRQHGTEKISQEKQAFEKIIDRHSEYYCRWFADQTNPRLLKAKGQKFILDAMTAEIENTRKAWLWALKNGKFKRLIGKTDSLGLYYIWRGGYLEGDRTFRSFIEALYSYTGGDDHYQSLSHASINNWLGFFSDLLGDSSRSFCLLQESRDLLNSPPVSDLDVRAEQAHNLMILARVYQSLMDESRSDFITQARELYREVDHPFGLPFGLTTSARFAIFEGKHDEAEQYLIESLDIYRKTGNEIGLTVSLAGLGNHAFVQNNYHLARKYFQESIEIAKEFNSPERVIPATLFLGTANIYTGQFNRAIRVLENCKMDSEERGLLGFQAYAQYFLGYARLHQGDYSQAAHCAKSALPLAEQTGELEMFSQAQMLLAAVDLAKGSSDKAHKGFQGAIKIGQQKRYAKVLFGEDCGTFGLACSQIGVGDTDRAQQLLLIYLQDAVKFHRMDKAMYALSGLAKLFFDTGEISLAVRLFRFTTSYPFVRNSQWFKDVLMDPIRNHFNTHQLDWNAQLDHENIWVLTSALISQI